MTPPGSRIALVLALVVVVGLSWTAREAANRRLVLVGNPGWVTSDPDSLYQARRVDRALGEGGVAGADPYLNHPHGSPIPWPPYYAAFLCRALAPFAPPASEQEGGRRRSFVERSVASVPLVLGVLTSALAAFAGWTLARGAGALVAGLGHALCAASIAYSKSGNGDHHAWVSLLAGALLVVLGVALGAGALDRPRRALLAGAGAGLLAGVLVGSWAGALLYVIEVELVLAWLILRQHRDRRAGLAQLGLGFHAAAMLALLPAVLASPWTQQQPWMVVNLSWFHLAFLAAGGLVFVPLLFLRAGALRVYPWVVACSLGLLAVVAWAGIREGFEWVGRTDAFMAKVGESRPLIGPGRLGDLVGALGYAAFVLPLAWIAMARRALRGGNPELLVWVVSAPFLAVQAARQARFGDALALPMWVVLAWGAGELLRMRADRTRHSPGALVVAGVAVVLASWPSAATLTRSLRTGQRAPHHVERAAVLAARTACDWLRANRPGSDDAVMAVWTWGHVIEWAADRPTVATNFGSYVGEDSFRDPCRFLMFEDPARAEELLQERGAAWVLVTSDLPNYLNLLIEVAAPERRSRYTRASSESGGNIQRPWFLTMGARLMFDGAVFFPGGPEPEGALARPLDFLRLIHISPLSDAERRLRSPTDVSPAAWLWERVPGARVEAHGRSGEVLEVRVKVRFAKARRTVEWADRVAADATGLARLRVPYATLDPNGDGWVPSDGATWSMGVHGGPLELSESEVLGGNVVRVGR